MMSNKDFEAITLNADQVEILGKPNFACADLAKLLFESGTYKKDSHKAEYNQAVVIHWLNSIYEEFGSGWRKEVSGRVQIMIDAVSSPTPQENDHG